MRHWNARHAKIRDICALFFFGGTFLGADLGDIVYTSARHGTRSAVGGLRVTQGAGVKKTRQARSGRVTSEKSRRRRDRARHFGTLTDG